MFYLSDSGTVNGAKIKVIGIGGGGGNAINTMISSGFKGVEFIAANTDIQSLNKNLASLKIQIGTATTKGLGAGGNPNVGREAALEDEEAIRGILADSDMVFITAGMGGGTGTGAAPVIAKIARDLGALTIGVVTKPFILEGKKRQKQAESGLEELQKYVDTLIMIPNERLKNIIATESFMESFKKVDEVLLQTVRGISDLVNKSGYVNLDFADIKATMQNSRGVALVGIGSGSGEGKAKKAATSAMTSPLLGNISIKGASGIILNLTVGSKVPMREVMESADYVTKTAGEDADVKFGVVTDEDMGDEIIMTLVATGISSSKEEYITADAPKEVVEKEETPKVEHRPSIRVERRPSASKDKENSLFDYKYDERSTSAPRLGGICYDDLETPAYIRKGRKDLPTE